MNSLRRTLLLLAVPVAARAATYTVTTTAASGPGSLSQAILDANANVGADTIEFNIPGSGVQMITGAPPDLTDPVSIDGYTQPGASPNTLAVGDDAVLLIQLVGGPLRIPAQGCAVSGLVIRGFTMPGDQANGGGNVISGNFIGTNADGSAASGNGVGVSISSWTNTIGGWNPADRNLISGNSGAGISIGFSKQNTVQNNYIGTNAAGTAAVPNLAGGINEHGGMTFSTYNKFIGNLISGNSGVGLYLDRGGDGQNSGNLIGTDATGTQPLGNSGAGVVVSEPAGPETVNNNTIAYNGGDGVFFSNLSFGISGNSIHDNAGLGIRRNPPYPGPVLLSAITIGDQTTITGIMSAGMQIDFFTNQACDPSGFGEGQTPAWSASVSSGPFSVVVPPIALGLFVTSTAYYQGTSMFSNCILVTGTPPTATPTPTQTPNWTPTPTPSPAPPTATPTPAPPTSTSTPPLSTPPPTPTPTPPLAVLSISPASGPGSGGTPFSVTGTGFLPGASLTIGGVMAENIVVVGSTEIDANAPALPAGTLDAVSVSTPALAASQTASLPTGWMAEFLDVAHGDPFAPDVEKVFRAGITAGCGGGLYCRDAAVRRDQMAVFLLKAKHGSDYSPPGCTGLFTDVDCPGPFTDWVEQLYAEGITGGCGVALYCPAAPVRRDQMAAFLLKAKHGSSFVPPGCIGLFPDVDCPGAFADWVEQLAAEGITGGCGGGNYCPGNANTRGQMAVFVNKTFPPQ